MEIENKMLKILMNSRDYVSGAKLAQILGVSRSTVNRIVKKLTAKGFVIEMHPKLGYRLTNLDDLRYLYKYVDYIDTEIKYSVHYIETCDSTQDVLSMLAKEGASEGTIVIAEELKRGRGRMGRQWIASKGGLWLSLLLKPKTMTYLHLLSLAIAIAVAQAIRELFNIEAKVKWPNDVLINEKKVSGILIEGSIEADTIHYIVVGIGINVNNTLTNELTEIATTLKNVVGSDVPRIPLALNLFKNIDMVYAMIKNNKIKEIVKTWKNYSSTINRYVKAITLTEEIEGLAQDIDYDGALIIKTNSGKTIKIHAGDIIHLKQ